ncbi:MAG: hypothetical protein WBC44_06145, partial [Planctomycetaceae bacterium]
MTAPTSALAVNEPTAPGGRLVAWVDGAGAFLLCLNDAATLGGLAGTADVRLTSDLAARHAAIQRSGEGYVVDATGPTIVACDASGRAGGVSPPRTSRSRSHGSGRIVQGRTNLNHNDELVLYRDGGGAVRLQFRRPNALTATATLVVASDHRTEPRYDGVVLLAEACVFGPGVDSHIRCREWEETVLLFRRDGRLWCKSALRLVV